MLALSALLALAVTTLTATTALARVDQTYGVHPDLLNKYEPDYQGKWRCLTTAKVLPWSAVNDDYCDCEDGSDEPGTGACIDTTFYCKNEGHIGASIPSSRVNDGLCEPQCCDGSDEKPGVCPNTCKEVGEAHRNKVEAERKIQKTGSKIRASYIAFAQKEKKRLEAAIVSSQREIAERENEVKRLKDIVDRTESLSAAELEEKKKSPLYQSLTTHALALKSLKREAERQKTRERQLDDILAALRTNYNPNYQDMAVLEAVRAYEKFAKLPHINDVRKAEADGTVLKQEEEGEAAASSEGTSDAGDEGLWSKEDIEKKLDEVLRADYDGLLLEHDRHTGKPPAESLLFDISSYLPAALVPSFELVRSQIVSLLTTAGVVQAPTDNSEATKRARDNLQDGEHSLKLAQDELRESEKQLAELFDTERFGSDGEWKKLEGTCLEKDAGEYIYEVCLFDEARQKPRHGGSTFSLGRFSGWNPDGHIGSPEYYSKQMYTNGAKCWNGPHRSVVLRLSCGTDNVLESVAELEKCEYEITGTSPALCLPLDSDSTIKKEEL